MCTDETGGCYTRVVVDHCHDLELAQLQAVMQRIQHSLHDIPAVQRSYISNALLNLAVNRMLCEQGSPHAASVLSRLSDAMHADTAPQAKAAHCPH